MVPGNAARLAGEPAAGGTSALFVASCLSNQFDIPGRCRYGWIKLTSPSSHRGRDTGTCARFWLGKPSVGVRQRTPWCHRRTAVSSFPLIINRVEMATRVHGSAEFTPEVPAHKPRKAAAGEPTGPSFMMALQEQLGLQ